MNRTNICKNIVQSIKDYITDQVKLEPHRVEKHFVRRRKLSLLQVIIYLFFSSKASMFQNLSQIREELGTLSFPDVSKQALSKARQFINPSLFKELYYLSVDLFYSQIPSRKLWQGYHLFAVDGSRIELPNSKSTFEFSIIRSFFVDLGITTLPFCNEYLIHTCGIVTPYFLAITSIYLSFTIFPVASGEYDIICILYLLQNSIEQYVITEEIG